MKRISDIDRIRSWFRTASVDAQTTMLEVIQSDLRAAKEANAPEKAPRAPRKPKDAPKEPVKEPPCE